jgi:uncharacterized protein (TIGR00725 family)
MRKPVIGVFGGGKGTVPAGSPTYWLAVALGRLLAQSGALVLCGGRGGVMEAVSRGAREAGGRSIGVLPFAAASGERANDSIDYALYTGLGDGRNFLTAAVPDAAIALAGEAGTLSEIGLALKVGTPLVYLAAWKFLNENGLPPVPYAETPEQAVSLVWAALGMAPGGHVKHPLRTPAVPEQTANLQGLADIVRQWS